MKKKTNKVSLKKLKITVQNCTKSPQTPTKKQFQQWGEATLINSSASTDLTIRIVSPEESAALNQKFRHKSGPTNVLSFAYAAIPGEEPPSLGDLVICAELVKQEAHIENKTLIERWAHMIVHGLLHLQGYDHETPTEAQEMEALEIKILQKLGFANPYEASPDQENQ